MTSILYQERRKHSQGPSGVITKERNQKGPRMPSEQSQAGESNEIPTTISREHPGDDGQSIVTDFRGVVWGLLHDK